ncbi:MAG TPA: hypothetical protein DDW67_06700, partial [Elusimicrobia bacterium]|nr:hypothetical protein [Elusimicrobiota bacterium]
MFWQLVSVSFLEAGAYTPELMVWTYTTGAASRLSVALFFLLTGGWVGFRLFFNGPKEKFKGVYPEWTLVLSILILIISSTVLFFYAPSDLSMWRATFLAENQSALRDVLLKYLPLLSFLGGVSSVSSVQPTLRLSGYISMCYLLSVLVLYGHKFSGLVSVLFPFLLGTGFSLYYLLKDTHLVRETLKRVFFLLIFSGLMMVRGFFLYLAAHYQEASSPGVLSKSEIAHSLTSYLTERILLLQGAMWWVVDRSIVKDANSYSWTKVWNYSFTCTSDRPFNSFLTEKYAGADRLRYLRERRVYFEGTSPAIYYELLGPAGPVLSFFVFGFVYSCFVVYLVRRLTTGNLVHVALIFITLMPIDCGGRESLD